MLGGKPFFECFQSLRIFAIIIRTLPKMFDEQRIQRKINSLIFIVPHLKARIK